MKLFSINGRALALLAVVVPLVALLAYVALRSGPLAPVAITVATVESRALTPALFGIGTVEARYTYKIGPTVAGRIQRLDVQVGDVVKAGQLLGEMDPVDLNDRIRSAEAALKRSEAAIKEAQARQVYAQTQARRYEQLLAAHSTSEEALANKRQEQQIADAVLLGAREEVTRLRADVAGLESQKTNLRLIAPVEGLAGGLAEGLVVARDADPGTTVVAGQAVVEVISPDSVWINTRFDQVSAAGLAAGLSASITLRSRSGQGLAGRVLRVEPLADAITEETLAKITFDQLPKPLPPVGELAEVTVTLPAHPSAPVIANAALRQVNNQLGVWQIDQDQLRFTPVTLGVADLEGYVQVRSGLKVGDQIVVYSANTLSTRSRFHVVEHLPGVAP
ncbi:MAG: efflux transporter periplasmic adaptor subunit [Gammaproteobacteria bacterium 28-57-27]|nr:MAG: efflux transporter periplasmic adaptor subunit [Gammaproteobacteria bacterium 28-57-27]